MNAAGSTMCDEQQYGLGINEQLAPISVKSSGREYTPENTVVEKLTLKSSYPQLGVGPSVSSSITIGYTSGE